MDLTQKHELDLQIDKLERELHSLSFAVVAKVYHGVPHSEYLKTAEDAYDVHLRLNELCAKRFPAD